MKSLLKLLLFVCFPCFALDLVGTVDEANVYRCFRDPDHYDRTVCVKIGTATASDAEVVAAQKAAEWVVPTRVIKNPFVGGQDEFCGNTHGGDACCRITATLPNGDVIVECGYR